MALTEEGIVHVPELLSRWVRLPSGAKAHYVTSGETGPAVVLLHGGVAGSSGTAGWRFMAPFLGANGFRVYCLDQLAFGLSEDPAEFYPLHEGGQVDFLHDFTTALCLDQFHLAGNSMGCSATANYVLAHPERVTRFAMIAGIIGDIGGAQEAVRKAMEEDTARSGDRAVSVPFDGTTEWMHSLMTKIAVDPSKISDDLVEMRTRAAVRNKERNEKWGQTRMLMMTGGELEANYKARMTKQGRLEKVTIPGIYVHGTLDVLMPYDVVGYRQEDALPQIQFFYPEDTGHQGQTDQPEVFNQLFLEFFRDGKVSWDTAQRAGISTRRPANPELVAVPEEATASST